MRPVDLNPLIRVVMIVIGLALATGQFDNLAAFAKREALRSAAVTSDATAGLLTVGATTIVRLIEMVALMVRIDFENTKYFDGMAATEKAQTIAVATARSAVLDASLAEVRQSVASLEALGVDSAELLEAFERSTLTKNFMGADMREQCITALTGPRTEAAPPTVAVRVDPTLARDAVDDDIAEDEASTPATAQAAQRRL